MHLSFFFFFTAPAPPEIYTLSLHDALPISVLVAGGFGQAGRRIVQRFVERGARHFVLVGRCGAAAPAAQEFVRSLKRSEEHTSELQSRRDLVCRLLLEKKKKKT